MNFKCDKQNAGQSYFTKKNSSYFKALSTESGSAITNKKALIVPIERAVIQGVIMCCANLTFIYAFKSGVNSGIIASLFSTCVIFTSLAFYILYG